MPSTRRDSAYRIPPSPRVRLGSLPPRRTHPARRSSASNSCGRLTFVKAPAPCGTDAFVCQPGDLSDFFSPPEGTPLLIFALEGVAADSQQVQERREA